jgi:hypothetical protein
VPRLSNTTGRSRRLKIALGHGPPPILEHTSRYLQGDSSLAKLATHRLRANVTFPSSTCEAGSISTVIATVSSHVCPSCPPYALAFRGMASNGRLRSEAGMHDAAAAACPSPGLQHPRSWLLIQHHVHRQMQMQSRLTWLHRAIRLGRPSLGFSRSLNGPTSTYKLGESVGLPLHRFRRSYIKSLAETPSL